MTENKGNLVIRRAFAKRDGVSLHRVEILARVTTRAMSTAYQMTEEVGEFGSGTPSPLHTVCELIRNLDERERQEEGNVSAALEVARYPLDFLRGLHAVPSESDARQKLNFLLKSVADANYTLKGRELKSLTPGELKEFSEMMMSTATLAHELAMIADGQANETQSSYPGSLRLREVAAR